MIINNLLTAVMISMAVGGNTATAFHKEPQKATSESSIESTITEYYNVNIGNIRNQISTLHEDDGDGTERTRSVYRYLDSKDNYLISGNTYSFNEDWYGFEITDDEVYTTSMNITILKCVPYYNVKLDNSTFTFVANGYWQTMSVYGETTWNTKAQALLYNTAYNIDEYMGLSNMTKSQMMNLYSLINNYNQNYVLSTSNDYYNSDIYEDEQGEPQWAEMPIELTIAQYSLNSRTPFYIVLTTEVICSWFDNGTPNVYYGSSLNNPTGMLNFNETWSNSTGPSGNIELEVIDIPNLMYTILTMPFSFISTAFNLTIFPNTPYQVNIGNIILLILTIFIVMFVIRLITRFMK